MTHPADGPWYYQQITLGYNYRLTDIQAALGASQLQRLDAYVARREKLARVYDEALADTPVTIPWQHLDGRSAWHLYVIRLRLGNGAASHRAVFDALRAAGIGVNLHYIPVHLQPSYRAMGFCEGQFPEAERYYGEAISLPLYPLLSDEHQEQVITELKRVLRK
jgi:dTDP-4-amino-4,6-dideoxygalactose transaminase